jgi:hypothetical protein
MGDVSPPCFFQGSAGQDLTRGLNSVSFSWGAPLTETDFLGTPASSVNFSFCLPRILGILGRGRRRDQANRRELLGLQGGESSRYGNANFRRIPARLLEGFCDFLARRGRLYDEGQLCLILCPPLRRKPSHLVGIGQGSKSSVIRQRINTIANHRTQCARRAPQLLTEGLLVRT